MEPIAPHVDRYVPAETNGGWGFATAVVLFAALCVAGVAYIHQHTYKHPTDVTWHGGSGGEAK